MVISETKEGATDERYIDWGKLYALTAFLVLILPFYQGMNRYLLVTYGELAEGAKPHSLYLIVDGAAFMVESALFFAMSRTLGLAYWARFYWVVFALLAVDSLWGLSVRLHSTNEAALTIERWTMLNLVTITLLALLVHFGELASNKHLVVALAAAGMVVRTIIDYVISWNFYFPN